MGSSKTTGRCCWPGYRVLAPYWQNKGSLGEQRWLWKRAAASRARVEQQRVTERVPKISRTYAAYAAHPTLVRRCRGLRVCGGMALGFRDKRCYMHFSGGEGDLEAPLVTCAPREEFGAGKSFHPLRQQKRAVRSEPPPGVFAVDSEGSASETSGGR